MNSDIYVTEVTSLPTHRRQQVSQPNSFTINAQICGVIQCAIPARRVIIECDSSRNNVLSHLEVLQLPDPPNTIDHAVMEIEGRIARGSVEVLMSFNALALRAHSSPFFISDSGSWISTYTAGITSDREMAASMNPPLALGGLALHHGFEPVNIAVILDQVQRIVDSGDSG